MNLISTLISSSRLQIRHSMARPMFKFILFVAPVFYSIITYTLFFHSSMTNFAAYAFLGTGLLSLWDSICFSSAGDMERERWMGTLQTTYNTPTDFRMIVAGKVMGNTLLGVIPFIVSFAVIKAGFQAEVSIVHMIPFCVAFLISIVSFACVAYFFAVVFLLSRSAAILMNFLGAPIHILRGLAFPIALLPAWTRPFSYLLPPTWAAELLRMCIQGITEWKQYYILSGMLVVESFTFIAISSYLYTVVDRRIRTDASLMIS